MDLRKSRGTIASAISEARASLNEPSRPFTPANLSRARTLFQYEEGDAAQSRQSLRQISASTQRAAAAADRKAMRKQRADGGGGGGGGGGSAAAGYVAAAEAAAAAAVDDGFDDDDDDGDDDDDDEDERDGDASPETDSGPASPSALASSRYDAELSELAAELSELRALPPDAVALALAPPARANGTTRERERK